MNELQKQILNIIQGKFPIESRPFSVLADQCSSTEDEIISQMKQLKEAGVIRYIGPVFDAGRLGYVSTLVAAKVPQEKIEGLVAEVNSLPGVTHNYGRKHAYNVWFTLMGPEQRYIDDTLERLRREFEIPAIYSLPAVKMYKIRVNFDFKPASGTPAAVESAADKPAEAEGNAHTFDAGVKAVSLTTEQMGLIRQLQVDLPIISEPFGVAAEAVGAEVGEVLRQIKDWKATGVIRRFGARVRHGQAGFRANGMVVFEVEGARLDEAGALLAGYSQVSHCYHRPGAPDWPYNLFAMTHSRDEAELKEVVEKMVEQVKPLRYDILLSIKEYKKSSAKYFLEDV
jgi:DNA-binding Lrp family transcriptional regulator